MPTTPAINTLFYGDNLDILREYIADESVDLVYLDPPFNSNATYNVLFKAPGGEQSQAQIEAFEDSWHWNAHAEAPRSLRRRILREPAARQIRESSNSHGRGPVRRQAPASAVDRSVGVQEGQA
jgi:adenine specific DNA methylase Mod